MVDPEGDQPARSQLANGGLYGPGCNGRFEHFEKFLKFVHPDKWVQGRPASSMFRKFEESASWEALATAISVTKTCPMYGVITVTTDLCVKLGQVIVYSPIINHPTLPNNPAHVDITGDKKAGIGSRRISRRFANECYTLLSPD